MARQRFVVAAVLSLSVMMVAEVALSTRRLSLSWDEGDHIYAGIHELEARRVQLEPGASAAGEAGGGAAFVAAEAGGGSARGADFKSESYYGGQGLLFRNDPQYGGSYSADTLVFRVHMAVMLFSLLVALL